MVLNNLMPHFFILGLVLGSKYLSEKFSSSWVLMTGTAFDYVYLHNTLEASSVVEDWPSRCKALDSISRSTNIK